MREVLTQLLEAYDRDEPVGVATVVRTWRSAPRPAGASMLVTADGEVVGSVSGGCVEGAVYEVASEVLAEGSTRYETYGVSDESAFTVGLTCGGILEVFVERVDRTTWPELPGLAASVNAHEPVAVATVVSGPTAVGRHVIVRPDRVEGSLGSSRLDDAVADDALGMLRDNWRPPMFRIVITARQCDWRLGLLAVGQPAERLARRTLSYGATSASCRTRSSP